MSPNQAVTALAWDKSSTNEGDGCLGVGERGGGVTLWTINDAKDEFCRRWIIKMPGNSIPRSLVFTGDLPKDLMVTSFEGRV